MSTFLFTNSNVGSSGGSTLRIVGQPGNAVGVRNGYGTVRTNSVSVDVVGGTPPYTYLWNQVGTSDPDVVPNASLHTCYFSAFVSSPPYWSFTNWECTVTDSATPVANTVISNVVAVSLDVSDTSGGGFIP